MVQTLKVQSLNVKVLYVVTQSDGELGTVLTL